jgi:hypothetical protein
LIAFRTVYAEGWGRVVGKAFGIAVIYAMAGMAALLLTTIWSVISASP